MNSNDSSKAIKDSLIDLYLNVKIRKQDQIDNYDNSDEEKEKDKLEKMHPLTIIEYVKTSIEILIDMKAEEITKQNSKKRRKEKINESSFSEYEEIETNSNEYEKLLRKHEADIRNYIKYEHQLKLYAESLQAKIDDLEKINNEQKEKIEKLKEQNKKLKTSNNKNTIENYEEEMKNYIKEISQLNKIIKTYEDHNLKVADVEKKIRILKVKHEKEIKEIESYYKGKIVMLTKNPYKRKNNETTSLTPSRDKSSKIDEKDKESKKQNNDFNFNKIRNLKLSLDKSRSRTQSADVEKKNTKHSQQLNESKKDSKKSTFKNNTNENKNSYNWNKNEINKIKERKTLYEIKNKINSNSLDVENNFLVKIDQFKKSAEKKLQDNLKNIVNNLKNFQIEKDRERLIKNCKTILDNDKTMEYLIKTDRGNFSEFNLKKNMNENKIHKKYNSHFDGNHKLIESNENKLDFGNNKFEINKKFIENYTSYNPYKRRNKEKGSLSHSNSNPQLKQISLCRVKSESKSVLGERKEVKVIGRKRSEASSDRKKFDNKLTNSVIVNESSGIPYCYNNINIFTSNSVNPNVNGDDARGDYPKSNNENNYKNILLNKVHKKTGSGLKAYNINNDEKKKKFRSNSGITKNI